ncbi:putative camp-dependent protein kinase regulatory subunit [Phaeomoniella chlamydospora]|uniref:cAMP-dependent protein kinase regulatory subunit n=1 Tax=Phaeomoniella chlamydospora TaxID=158046 RepID=A0A0G2GY85_PHACM|nr:putative camp-dependent protein kinase regulatory subunit [Phaeomoniella chlamydospora]
MSLPTSYQNELNALNREIAKAQPDDVLQFCANFFLRRLEAQRQEFLLQQTTSKAGGKNNKMAGSAFPGTMSFGSNNVFGDSTKRNPHAIAEEDENDPMGSPTNATFTSPRSGDAAQSSGSPFTNASPFGSAFGSAVDTNGNVPDEGAAGPPSFFPGSGGAGAAVGGAGRRTSVSAESLQPNTGDENWRPPNHFKTPEQLSRLQSAVASNFLFSSLDDDSFQTVLSALVEKPIPAANIRVIVQGDAGDYFYVVEKGEFDIYINPSGSVQSGADGLGNKVATIGPGGAFGELALMYNAPRAATVVSKEGKCTLWALDRITFRRILMDSAFQRRRMYEGFLEEVPLLSSLKGYERAKIADALESVKFPAGSKIINEGDPGDAFYLLESGEAEAFKAGVEKPVKAYSRGDYFGELALLDDKPRAASVIAKTSVKVARLDREGFKRLLGPVESIMRREDYDVDPLSQSKTAT